MVDVSAMDEALVKDEGGSGMLAAQTDASPSIKLNGSIFALFERTARRLACRRLVTI